MDGRGYAKSFSTGFKIIGIIIFVIAMIIGIVVGCLI